MSPDGHPLLFVQLLLHCGLAVAVAVAVAFDVLVAVAVDVAVTVAVAVGVAVLQTQLLAVVQELFLQKPDVCPDAM